MTASASAQQRTIYDARGTLSNMSRDWSRWCAADWQPLENELKELS